MHFKHQDICYNIIPNSYIIVRDRYNKFPCTIKSTMMNGKGSIVPNSRPELRATQFATMALCMAPARQQGGRGVRLTK